jgi:hypothetical protein
MSRIFWLILGAAVGFVAAHFASRTSTGQRVFTQIDRGAKEFTEAVARGYRSREAEFSSTLNDVERALTDLKSK